MSVGLLTSLDSGLIEYLVVNSGRSWQIASKPKKSLQCVQQAVQLYAPRVLRKCQHTMVCWGIKDVQSVYQTISSSLQLCHKVAIIPEDRLLTQLQFFLQTIKKTQIFCTLKLWQVSSCFPKTLIHFYDSYWNSKDNRQFNSVTSMMLKLYKYLKLGYKTFTKIMTEIHHLSLNPFTRKNISNCTSLYLYILIRIEGKVRFLIHRSLNENFSLRIRYQFSKTMANNRKILVVKWSNGCPWNSHKNLFHLRMYNLAVENFLVGECFINEIIPNWDIARKTKSLQTSK